MQAGGGNPASLGLDLITDTVSPSMFYSRLGNPRTGRKIINRAPLKISLTTNMEIMFVVLGWQKLRQRL